MIPIVDPMKLLVVVLWIGFVYPSAAQPVKIRDFSEKYEVVVLPNAKDTLVSNRYDTFVPEYVLQVREQKTQKKVLEAYTSGLPAHLSEDSEKELSGMQERPYDSQSIVFYEDYNFDGKKDFALMNGYGSCYGGPSFDIYLAKGDGFEYSKAFSDLSNEYCGMFEADAKTKTLHTTTKSGCCWHQFSEFKVVNDEPKPIKITERSYTADRNFIEVTEFTYPNGKEQSTQNYYFPLEEMTSQILLYFELESQEKYVVLYEADQKLHYVFLQKDDLIEFYFPQNHENNVEALLQKEAFHYNSAKGTLTFSQEDARYEIYETPDGIGIKVFTKGKTYDRKGIPSTAIGSLHKVRLVKLTNTLFEQQ